MWLRSVTVTLTRLICHLSGAHIQPTDSSVVRIWTRAPGIPGSSLAIAAHFLLCRLKDYCNFADGRVFRNFTILN
ncbi:hypothetical protein J6590_087356 [Homalodisca vitripennis]|nr:hypothetical protein J6590_086174 [Homalodisca vitripennis]KAG8329392.1 hypothetical protein J6590_087356 [Homalodisca vitripennis]